MIKCSLINQKLQCSKKKKRTFDKLINYFFQQTLQNNVRNINEEILSHGEDQLIQTFLYSNRNFNLTVNRLILNAATEYLISTERFKCPLFN